MLPSPKRISFHICFVCGVCVCLYAYMYAHTCHTSAVSAEAQDIGCLEARDAGRCVGAGDQTWVLLKRVLIHLC